MSDLSIDRILLMLLCVLVAFVVAKAMSLPKSFTENQRKREELQRKYQNTITLMEEDTSAKNDDEVVKENNLKNEEPE